MKGGFVRKPTGVVCFFKHRPYQPAALEANSWKTIRHGTSIRISLVDAYSLQRRRYFGLDRGKLLSERLGVQCRLGGYRDFVIIDHFVMETVSERAPAIRRSG